MRYNVYMPIFCSAPRLSVLVIAKTRFETKNEVCQALAGIGVHIEELRIEDFDLSGLVDFV